MRILTYKRTHIGDPDAAGHFGINDCMGRVRNWSFDAVIGVGGYGREPQSYGIEGRVNWVGLNPTWQPHPEGYGLIVTFEFFALLEAKGPLLIGVAPSLARRMYEKRARVLFKSYSPEEKAEAEALVRSMFHSRLEQGPAVAVNAVRARCLSNAKTRKRCRTRTLTSRCSSFRPTASTGRPCQGAAKQKLHGLPLRSSNAI